MVTRDKWLREASGNQEAGVPTVYGALAKSGPAPERVTPVQQGADLRRDAGRGPSARGEGKVIRAIDRYDTTGHWTSTFPHGPLGLAVRVLTWAGSEVPNGWVVMKGPKANDSSREVLAWLQPARVDAPTTQRWLAQYGDAITPEDRALRAALDGAERRQEDRGAAPRG